MNKKNNQQMRLSKSEKRHIWVLASIPIAFFFIKLLVILRIQGFDWYSAGSGSSVAGILKLLEERYAPANAWIGADGENYLQGVVGLSRDGFLSKEENLSYWPAGYPLLLWLGLLVFKGHFFLGVSVLQSLIYGFACFFLVYELSKTQLRKFSKFMALLLAVNPTLSLSSLSIGYEAPVAAMLMISIACLIRSTRLDKDSFINTEMIGSALCLGLATFMQPRAILLAIVVIILWALARHTLKIAVLFSIVSLFIVILFPIVMISRNFLANGYAAVSTNLGTTMEIGAGPKATGGYLVNYEPLNCPKVKTAENPAIADRERVFCVLRWYQENPVKLLALSLNKSKFFWSPWFGPEANGTMARNPWLTIHPFKATVKTEDGFNMVYGTIGKTISWIWMIGGLYLLLRGFLVTWKFDDLERLLGLVAISVIAFNMLTSAMTIGDHRFRIPTMGLSLLLQSIGLLSAKKSAVNSQKSRYPVSWPGLHWKAESKPDKLHS